MKSKFAWLLALAFAGLAVPAISSPAWALDGPVRPHIAAALDGPVRPHDGPVRPHLTTLDGPVRPHVASSPALDGPVRPH